MAPSLLKNDPMFLLDLSPTDLQERLNEHEFSMKVEDLDVLSQELRILEKFARNNIEIFEKISEKNEQDHEKIKSERALVTDTRKKFAILCKKNPSFLLDLSSVDFQERMNENEYSMQVEDLEALCQTLESKKDLIVGYQQKLVILRTIIRRAKSDAKMSLLVDLSPSDFKNYLNKSDFSMQVEDLDVLYQELTVLERLALNNINVFEENSEKSEQNREKIKTDKDLMSNASEKLKILYEKELSILVDLSPSDFQKYLSVRESSIKVEDLEELCQALTKREKLERQNVDFFERKQDKTKEGREEKAYEKDLVHESAEKLTILGNLINHKKLQNKTIKDILLHIYSITESLKKRHEEGNKIASEDSKKHEIYKKIKKFVNSDKTDTNYLLPQPESDLLKIEHEAEALLKKVDILFIDIKKEQSFSNKELFSDKLQQAVLQRAINVSNEYLAALNPYHHRYHSFEPSGRFVQDIQYAFCPVQYGYKTLELCSSCPKDEDVKVQNTPYLYVRHNNGGIQQVYCAFKSKEGIVERFEIPLEELHDESNIIWLALQHKVLTWKQEQKIFKAIAALKGDRYQLAVSERLALLEKIEAPAEKGLAVPINEAILRQKFKDAKDVAHDTNLIIDKVKCIPRFLPILENKLLTNQEKLHQIFAQEKQKAQASKTFVDNFKTFIADFRKNYVISKIATGIKNMMKSVFGYELVANKDQEEEATHEKSWNEAKTMYHNLKKNLECSLNVSGNKKHLDSHQNESKPKDNQLEREKNFSVAFDKKRSSMSDENLDGIGLKNHNHQ